MDESNPSYTTLGASSSLDRPGTSHSSPARRGKSGQEVFEQFVAEQAAAADAKAADPVPLREQDRFLPIANVARIMKSMVPKNGKISKEAKECCQECVSEFISFVTSEASEKCALEKRKTINAEDLINAMANLGFDQYIEPLKLYLVKYREMAKSERMMFQSPSVLGSSADMEEMEDESLALGMLGSVDPNQAPGQNSPQPSSIGAFSSHLRHQTGFHL